MGKQINNQPEAGKAIKRVNERIAALTRMQSTDNPYIAAYSRAIHELGLKFTKVPGTNQYKIANTAENRKKAQNLEKRLRELKAKTVGDIRAQAKKEVKAEAEAKAAKAKEQAISAGVNEKKAERERKKFIRENTAQKRVNQRVKEMLLDISIQDKLDIIYQTMGEAGKELGQQLSALTRGKSRGQQDSAEIYDIFGRISDTYRQIQSGELQMADEQRSEDLTALYRNFSKD